MIATGIQPVLSALGHEIRLLGVSSDEGRYQCSALRAHETGALVTMLPIAVPVACHCKLED